MPWSLTTAPVLPAVTLTEVKEHLRIEHNDENDWLERAITAAITLAQNYTGRQFITATWTYYMPVFPGGRYIELGKPPLQSVTSIIYKDVAGTSQTLASATNYTVYTTTEPGYIELHQTASWPSTYGDSQDIAIKFVAGYGLTSASVPGPIRTALCSIVAHWHLFREPNAMGLSIMPVPETSLKFLLGPYKMDWA
jgi:uncharacterized phiE125 gp8 family phage protein